MIWIYRASSKKMTQTWSLEVEKRLENITDTDFKKLSLQAGW